MFMKPYERQTTSKGISFLTFGPNTRHRCLICIHGWACQATNFTLLLDELSKKEERWRLIAIDLPGHGQSLTQEYADGSLTTMSDAVLDLIQNLNTHEIVLTGHSMGMRAVLEIWRRMREHEMPEVKGLVFLDGSHYRLRKSLFAFDSGDARSKDLSREERIARMEEAFEHMFSASTPESFQVPTLQHVRHMDLDFSDSMRKSFVAFDFNEMDGVLEALGKSQVDVMSLQATYVDEDNQRIPLQSGEWSKWMRFCRRKCLKPSSL